MTGCDPVSGPAEMRRLIDNLLYQISDKKSTIITYIQYIIKFYYNILDINRIKRRRILKGTGPVFPSGEACFPLFLRPCPAAGPPAFHAPGQAVPNVIFPVRFNGLQTSRARPGTAPFGELEIRAACRGWRRGRHKKRAGRGPALLYFSPRIMRISEVFTVLS